MCVTLLSVSPSIHLQLPPQHLWPPFWEALLYVGASRLVQRAVRTPLEEQILLWDLNAGLLLGLLR